MAWKRSGVQFSLAPLGSRSGGGREVIHQVSHRSDLAQSVGVEAASSCGRHDSGLDYTNEDAHSMAAKLATLELTGVLSRLRGPRSSGTT